MAGCSLTCCGGFCLFVSIICAAMQFVFYGLVASDNQRIEIGESSEEREKWKNTPLITAIVYCVFVLLSIGCLGFGGRQKTVSFDADMPIDEHSSLVDNSDVPMDDEDDRAPIVSDNGNIQ